MTTNCTLSGLYPDSLYKFYVKAISEGGESDVSVTEIHTGEPNANLARSIQSSESNVPGMYW